MFRYPYGKSQALNLDWFIKQFNKLREAWASAEEGIAGALQDEIDRAETAMSDVFTARDTAVAAKNDALTAKSDALQASANAAQYWQNAANSASAAAGSAGTALQAAEDAETAEGNAQTAEANAAVSNTQAGVNKFMAEAWAAGTMNGTPVGSGTIQYQNNAKYYAQQASGDAAQTALDRAAVAQDKDDTDTIKDNANAAALRAEGWADGTQNGTQVASGSPYYENNAKYYKEAAEDVLESIPADYSELAAEVASQSEKIDDLKSAIGNLNDLETSDKTNLVSAINEAASTGGQSNGDYAPVIISSASGTIATFNDGADGMPVQSLTVNIEPVQSGSGDPSPNNVRPITGWTGANVFNDAEYTTSATPKLSVSWETEAGVVYKGILDVTNGKIKPTHSLWTFTTEFAVSDYSTETKHLFIAKRPSAFPQTTVYYWDMKYYSNILSLLSRGTSSTNIQDSSMYVGTGYIIIRLDSIEASTEAIVAFFTEHPLQILAPILSGSVVEYDITKQQILTLLGTNNIWADAGDTTVEYRADTKLYIQQLTQPTEDDMTANANIAANKFFTIGNKLYFSNAAIAAGETIIVGTNCNEVSLADALNQINT